LTKVRVENLHYDITESDLEVSVSPTSRYPPTTQN
jgi:hypothetical protein